MNDKNIKIAAIAGIAAAAGSLFAGVPLNNLQGTGGIAFNPLAYTAGRPWSGDGGGDGTNEVPASAWVMRSDARDDRMLVFSKKFTLERGHEAKFRYQVRVVSAGEFVLPGPSVEGMYHPALHARRVPGRIVVRH